MRTRRWMALLWIGSTVSAADSRTRHDSEIRFLREQAQAVVEAQALAQRKTNHNALGEALQAMEAFMPPKIEPAAQSKLEVVREKPSKRGTKGKLPQSMLVERALRGSRRRS